MNPQRTVVIIYMMIRVIAIDPDGNVHVPDAPGLGIRLDWDYIEKHRTARVVFD